MRGDDMELDPVTAALREAEDAVSSISYGGASDVQLASQNAYIRRLQHEIAQRYGLNSTSRGREPFRRITMTSASQGPVAARCPAWPPPADR
jgi:hypothetical protein